MNEIMEFTDAEFGKIRSVKINEEIWFVGKDVAIALGYTDISHSITDHVDEEDRVNSKNIGLIDPAFGQRGAWLVNESGLYSLILSSKLPDAKKFKQWVTSEVLPSIRKHGAYITPELVEKALLDPDIMIQLCTTIKEEREKRKKLEEENQVMKPKAEYFDDLVDRRLLTNFRNTAKELKIKEKEFIQFLLDKRYIYRNQKGVLCPYAQYVSSLFEVKECASKTTKWAGTQTLITPKGRETFRLLLKKDSNSEI